MKKNIILLALLSAPLCVNAAEDAVQKQGWSGAGEFGLVLSRGNTDTDTVNLKLGAVNRDGDWTHTYSAAALRATDSDVTKVNRFELGGKSGRDLNTRSYLAGAVRYEKDDFAAYENQTTLSVNYGYRVLNSDIRKLVVEVGPGYKRSTERNSDNSEGRAMLRGFVDYKHKLTDTTELINTLLVESASNNTFVQNDLGVAVKINSSLALKAGVQTRHNTDAPAGSKKTDTLTAINLVYGF